MEEKDICKICGEDKEEHCEAIDKETGKEVLVCMKTFWSKCFSHKKPTFFISSKSSEEILK